MKYILFTLVCLALITDFSYSQRRVVRVLVKRTWFWTMGIDGGLTLPMGDLSNTYKTSGNAGLELAYHPGPNFAFFFNSQYNFMSAKDPSISGTPSYIELGVGGRLYFGKGPGKLFIEGGFGDYIYRYSSYNPYYGYSTAYSQGNFGLKGGIGGDMAVARRTSLFIKTEYHTIFTPGTNSNYVGVYGGVNFIF